MLLHECQPQVDLPPMDLAHRFSGDYAETPYWWRAAPPTSLEQMPVPSQADVAIVGSGITGLNAALELARAGRKVVVFDAGDAGAGASSRNAGFVGRSLKHSFGDLLRRVGPETAVAVYQEMQAAFDSVAEVVQAEGLACHFNKCGRLILAASQRQLDALGAELALKKEHLDDEYQLLTRQELPNEIATNRFAGAAVVPGMASIHPGLYHRGLLERVRQTGVQVLAHTPVTGIVADIHRATIKTTRGELHAHDVIVATNGYTGAGASAWLQRRLIPFDAYMIATEPVDKAVLDSLLPTNRTYIDENQNIIYLRRAPDESRILFGGRTGSRPGSLHERALELHRMASAILPGMQGLKISNAWTGRCAATFDLYPHLGRKDGVWYAAGYCFAGVPMGTYLGRKLAWRVLGLTQGKSVFEGRPFPTMPFYTGNPWFVPHAMKVYDLLDAFASRGRPANDPFEPIGTKHL